MSEEWMSAAKYVYLLDSYVLIVKCLISLKTLANTVIQI